MDFNLNFLQQFFAIFSVFTNSEIQNKTNFTVDFPQTFELLDPFHHRDSVNETIFTFPSCCNFTFPSGKKSLNCNHTDFYYIDYTDYGFPFVENLESNLNFPKNIFPSENPTNLKFELSFPKCAKGHKYISHIGGKSAKVENQGRFLRNSYFGHDNEYYSPQEYCINGITGESVEVKICEPECSKERPCIQKCCPQDEIYSFGQRKCIKSNPVLYNPIFHLYHDMSHQLNEKEQKSVHPHYSIRFPKSFKHNCQENMTQIFPSGILFAEHLSNSTGRKYHPADFRLRKDGVILYRKDGKAIVPPDGHPIFLRENSRKCYSLKTNHYCIDGATEYGSSQDFSNDENQVFFVTCSELLYEPPVIGPLSFVYGNVMIASSIFSLSTVLVYLMLKEKRNIHGWTVISYALSMFFMYVFLGLAHLIRYYGSDEVLKTNICVLIGIVGHFFSLSSFLWLTMINWDLYSTFRKIRPTVVKASKNDFKLWNHYLKYCFIGWGIPLIILSASSYLHFNYEQPTEEDCYISEVPLPAYGRESCEIKQLSLGVYLYFPATALLFCNLLFFIVTTYSLCKHEKMTLIAVNRLERQHQSVHLFGKLFFVMGVTRIFEIITWAESGTNLTWYWSFFDLFNILQAVAIFIIYVCKRDILQALVKKISSFRDCFLIRGKGYDGRTLSHRK